MISIIIPTYNEADQIAQTIAKIRDHSTTSLIQEILVIDGGSTDDTVTIARASGAVAVVSKQKGRAAQMNKGALLAKGTLLYFLHADSLPPKGFDQSVAGAFAKGYGSGCFRLAFDDDHPFLKANAWFTRFDVNGVRFGDQSLFVAKEVFEQCGGFKEELWMMEDQEIIHRIKQHSRFIVLKDSVVTSARKYHDNGVYRMQAIFFRIWFLYYLGYSQERLLRLYKRLIRKHKL